jgi:Zn-finger nucleic acid-binding protein
MKPFQAGRVDLDRCTFCRELWFDGGELWFDGGELWFDGGELWFDGGELWFDGGELEALLGRKLSPAFAPVMQTNRTCAACTIPMVPAELGGLRVEVCRSDRGFFLDEHGRVALNGGKRVAIGAPMPEVKVKNDVNSWLEALGV